MTLSRLFSLRTLAVLSGCLGFVGHSFAASEADAGGPRVTTANGVVEGFVDSANGLDVFLGVPFAQPPVGELRWKAPQPLQDWNGVRPAKQFAKQAVQARVFGDMRMRSNGMGEDCLYLNVWAPKGAAKAGKKLPVLLYYYGGGFVAGDGSELRYDGGSLAEKGIVAVTCNYRLALFGFLAHPELSAEAPYQGIGSSTALFCESGR